MGFFDGFHSIHACAASSAFPSKSISKGLEKLSSVVHFVETLSDKISSFSFSSYPVVSENFNSLFYCSTCLTQRRKFMEIIGVCWPPINIRHNYLILFSFLAAKNYQTLLSSSFGRSSLSSFSSITFFISNACIFSASYDTASELFHFLILCPLGANINSARRLKLN